MFNSQYHKANDRNPDYFTCPKATDLLKQSKSAFKDMDHFKSGLLKKLDDYHGGNQWHCFVWNGKSQYAHIKCIHKECVY